MGGGAELATACDLRLVTERTKVQFVQLKLGVTTGWGGLTRLVKMVGRQQALQLLCGMRPLDASEALRVGFADHAIPPSSPSSPSSLLLEGDRRDSRGDDNGNDSSDSDSVHHRYVLDYVSRHFLSDALQDVSVLRTMKALLHEIADHHDTTRSPADSYAREREVFASVWGGAANLRALAAAARK